MSTNAAAAYIQAYNIVMSAMRHVSPSSGTRYAGKFVSSRLWAPALEVASDYRGTGYVDACAQVWNGLVMKATARHLTRLYAASEMPALWPIPAVY